jgi:hypothetical protein
MKSLSRKEAVKIVKEIDSNRFKNFTGEPAPGENYGSLRYFLMKFFKIKAGELR